MTKGTSLWGSAAVLLVLAGAWGTGCGDDEETSTTTTAAGVGGAGGAGGGGNGGAGGGGNGGSGGGTTSGSGGSGGGEGGAGGGGGAGGAGPYESCGDCTDGSSGAPVNECAAAVDACAADADCLAIYDCVYFGEGGPGPCTTDAEGACCTAGCYEALGSSQAAIDLYEDADGCIYCETCRDLCDADGIAASEYCTALAAPDPCSP